MKDFDLDQVRALMDEARKDERRVVADHILSLFNSLIVPAENKRRLQSGGYLGGYRAALKTIAAFLEEDENGTEAN